MALAEFIQEWGYLAIVVGTFFEGETILVLGGIAAHQGNLSLPLVMLSAFIGSLAGDQLWFLVGRKLGKRLMNKRPHWRRRAKKVRALLYRHKVPFILSFRFLYGLRSVAPFVTGMTPIRAWQYAVLNVIGAIVWAIAVALLGYFCGEAYERLSERLGPWFWYVLGALAVIGLGIWILRRLRTLRQRALERAAQAAAQPPLTALPPKEPA